MKGYNISYQEEIKNMITNGDIKLYNDHTDLNIHCEYKGYEITSELNVPYLYYKNKSNPSGYINQILSDETKMEKVSEDVFRRLVIHISVDKFINEDDEWFEDTDEEVYDEEFNEEYEDYQDRLQKHFPGVFLTEEQQKNYDKVNEKVYVLIGIMEYEDKDIYQFVSEYGLTIHSDKITFYAPYLSKSVYEWVGWCCNIIDKILRFFTDEEDNEDLTDDINDEEYVNEEDD